MAVALIVAAGRGERLGSGRPKALVALAGRPMLDWSVDAIRAVDTIERIVVALPAEALDAAPPGTVAVAGGTVRSESVRLALDAAGDGDPVVVHDAARPLADADLFRRALAELAESGADAVIAAAPVSDTIKQVGDDGAHGRAHARTGSPVGRPDPAGVPPGGAGARARRRLHGVLAGATDEASLVERGGGVVRVVRSVPENLKVTTPGDLHVAELLLDRAPDDDRPHRTRL